MPRCGTAKNDQKHSIVLTCASWKPSSSSSRAYFPTRCKRFYKYITKGAMPHKELCPDRWGALDLEPLKVAHRVVHAAPSLEPSKVGGSASETDSGIEQPYPAPTALSCSAIVSAPGSPISAVPGSDGSTPWPIAADSTSRDRYSTPRRAVVSIQ